MQRYKVLTDDDIIKIHENSLKIMEEVGVVLTYEPARELLVKHGAKVDGKKVFLPRNMVEEKLKTVPSSFTVYSRNPERNVTFDTETTHFVGPGGAASVMDLDRGRRPSKKADFIELVKLYHSLDLIDMHHHPCELNDVPEKDRHLELAYQIMKYSDKPFMGMIFGPQQARETLEMVAMTFGGMDAIRDKCVVMAIPCTVTPLSYDDMALATLMTFAELGQPQLINSLCMAGATAPATIAGAISVQNAEVLTGIVLTQCVNPGAPVVYSASGSCADMRACSLTVGAPEDALFSLINGQLTKFYNIPCRISGNICDSKSVDAQAGYESMMNLMTAQMAGGNFILHGAGIVDTYGAVSYEKIIMDNEVLGMVHRIGRGIEVNVDTLAFDVIKEVGPQGQFLTNEHTYSHFQKEFYRPTLSDRSTLAAWTDGGCLNAEQRANVKWKQILADYTQPALSMDIENDLNKYVEEHK